MVTEPTILSRISDELETYPRGGRAVAQAILENPERVLCMSLVEFSSRAKVSDPTVLRFCRSLGFDGYKAFKHGLALELGSIGRDGMSAETRGPLGTSLDGMVAWRKLAFDMLMDTLDRGVFEQAVELLSQAKRVVCCSQQESAPLAYDAIARFTRAGISATMQDCSSPDALSAADLKAGDVVLAFSRTADDAAIAKAVNRAVRRGYGAVAVTVQGSHLAQSSAMALTLRQIDTRDMHKDMSLWVAQRFVVDALTLATSRLRLNHLTER